MKHKGKQVKHMELTNPDSEKQYVKFDKNEKKKNKGIEEIYEE